MRIDTTEYKPVVVSSKYVCDKCGVEIKKEYDHNICDYNITHKIERANEEEQDVVIKSKLELCVKCNDTLRDLLRTHGFKTVEVSVKGITRNT